MKRYQYQITDQFCVFPTKHTDQTMMIELVVVGNEDGSECIWLLSCLMCNLWFSDALPSIIPWRAYCPLADKWYKTVYRVGGLLTTPTRGYDLTKTVRKKEKKRSKTQLLPTCSKILNCIFLTYRRIYRTSGLSLKVSEATVRRPPVFGSSVSTVRGLKVVPAAQVVVSSVVWDINVTFFAC